MTNINNDPIMLNEFEYSTKSLGDWITVDGVVYELVSHGTVGYPTLDDRTDIIEIPNPS